MKRLDVADYLLIAEAALDISVDRLRHLVDLEAAESALAGPLTSLGATDPVPGLATKAAVLCARLIENHPLPHGNTRVAYLCMREVLARNGLRWHRPTGVEGIDMVERLASRRVSEREFADWVVRHVGRAG